MKKFGKNYYIMVICLKMTIPNNAEKIWISLIISNFIQESNNRKNLSHHKTSKNNSLLIRFNKELKLNILAFISSKDNNDLTKFTYHFFQVDNMLYLLAIIYNFFYIIISFYFKKDIKTSKVNYLSYTVECDSKGIIVLLKNIYISCQFNFVQFKIF